MSLRALPTFGALVFAAVAPADDGALYDSGAPRLMHGESKIRMVRADVRVKVFLAYARVYCRFVFHNDGPVTTARVGFPDGDDIGQEGDDIAEPCTYYFRSAVDGRAASTSIERPAAHGPDNPGLFHVKRVPFGAGQTRVIEDWYETPLGSSAASFSRSKDPNNWHLSGEEMLFRYVMYSGGSWKRTIGAAVESASRRHAVQQTHAKQGKRS